MVALTGTLNVPDGQFKLRLTAGIYRWKPIMSNSNFSSLFSSLDSAATELNQVSDSVNKTLETIETKLVSLNIGFDIWFPNPINRSDSQGGAGLRETSTEYGDVIGFSHADGRWCLAHKKLKWITGFYQGDEECIYTNEYRHGDISPLSKQSRELRIKAVEVMPEFLAHCIQEIREKSQKIVGVQSHLNV